MAAGRQGWARGRCRSRSTNDRFRDRPLGGQATELGRNRLPCAETQPGGQAIEGSPPSNWAKLLRSGTSPPRSAGIMQSSPPHSADTIRSDGVLV